MSWNIRLFKIIILLIVNTVYSNGMTHHEAVERCTKELQTFKTDSELNSIPNHKEILALLEDIIQKIIVNKDKDWWTDYTNCQKGLQCLAWLSHNANAIKQLKNVKSSKKDVIKKNKSSTKK